MKKALKLFLLCCSSAIIMSGCGVNNTPQQPLCRVVTRVDISCQTEHMLMQRHYTHPDKMEYVLLYLRLLKFRGKPDTDPEQINKDIYEITVHLSDGSKKLYKQKAHRYFSRDSRPWEMIDPAQAAGLYLLMQKVPSDPVTSPM